MIFDNDWFTRWQQSLLWFANTNYGRDVLGLTTTGSNVGNSKIIKILPHTIFWKEDELYKAEFRTHDKFSKRLFYEYQYIWKALHTWDTLFANNFNPQWNVGFDTLTAYPDSGDPGTKTIDGILYRSGVDETLATIRAGAGTAKATTNGANSTWLQSSTTTSQYTAMARCAFLFDTSPIMKTSSISAATFSLWPTATDGDLGATKLDQFAGTNPNLHVCSSAPSSNTTLANADFSTLGTTSFGNITYASYGTGAYQDIALNASGITAITLEGVSKFGTKTDWDINNNFTGTWASTKTAGFAYFMADNAGTTNDPKLVVTYIPPIPWHPAVEEPYLISPKVVSY